jgi:PiT family inorganic phosphate transporter
MFTEAKAVSAVGVLVTLAVVFLAYSNGANDNFKGVATLLGSGTCTYRAALTWATLTTAAGSLLALLLANGLVATFKGKGVVPDSVAAQPAFLLAIGLGAALTVLLATRTGLPVSTTHALTGGLVGAGLVAAPGEVNFAALGYLFALPMLLSPIVALLLTLIAYPPLTLVRGALRVHRHAALLLEGVWEVVDTSKEGTRTVTRIGMILSLEQEAACVERYRGRVLGLEAAPVLDGVHYLSGGAVGFARGLNDTPKIVAILLACQALAPVPGLAVVALAMALGGLFNARRVADTLSRRITRMSPGQGLTANLVTALLVGAASLGGLPVSTTHVAVGALFAIGLVTGSARKKTIVGILLAWVTTLPIGAVLSAAVYCLASWALAGTHD